MRRTPGRHAQRQGLLHAVLVVVAVLWLFPFLWAVYTSLRPYADTAELGYASIAGTLSLDNYVTAWRDANLPQFLLNTLLVVVPAVVVVLAIASALAFALSRLSWRWNLGLLLFFTAGNLLPPQVLITPLFRLFLALPLPAPLSDNGTFYDQYAGIAAIHIAFQLGFCTFVLSNFMKTIPREVLEAAVVDGASVWRQLRSVALPLSRPALAALAVLEFTWLYNDYFWALVLMRTGDRRPITSALSGLAGQYFTDTNLLAAAAAIVAIPTLVVFLALQRHLVRGLTLGAGE
jgi:multiple sugar transport system permease protein